MQDELKVDSKMHFKALDGYRALAVTFVFCAHYGGGLHQSRALQWLDRITAMGVSGVGMFFVLSGFLITGILYDTQKDPHFFRTFYARRALRIFPIAYLVLAACAIATPFVGYRLGWGHIWFLLYLGNIIGHWQGWLYVLRSPQHPALAIDLGHFWSLFVEEQFYLIWPVVVYLIRDRIRLLRVGAGIIVFAFLVRVACVLFLHGDAVMDATFRQLPSRADDLVLGGCLALLLRGPNARLWLRRSGLILACGCAGLIALFVFDYKHGVVGFYGPWAQTIGMDFVSIASFGLIGLSIQPGTTAFRFLSVRPLRVIGIYSYGFYIYHCLFMASRDVFLKWLELRLHSVALAGVLVAAIYYGATLAVAALSYELYERRFLNLKKYFPYTHRKELVVA